MKTMLGSILFSETAADTAEEITVVTQYSDTRMPILSMIFLGLGILILLAVTIAGFLLLRKNFKNWGYALIAGFTAYLLFGYLVYMLAQVGLSKIPGIEDWAAANEKGYTMILLVISVILECLGVYLGMLYQVRNSEKKNLGLDIGSAIGFSLAYFTAAYVAAKQLSYSFEYILVGNTVNTSGFDTVISSLVSAGNTEEDSVEVLLALCTQPAVNYLYEAIHYILLGVVTLLASVVFYGCMTEKLEKKWYAYGVLLTVCFGVPNVISTWAELSTTLNLVLCILILGAFAYILWYFKKDYLKEELEGIRAARDERNKRAYQEKHKKMPTIKMPD